MYTIPRTVNPTTALPRRTPGDMKSSLAQRDVPKWVHKRPSVRRVQNYAIAAAETVPAKVCGRITAHAGWPVLTGTSQLMNNNAYKSNDTCRISAPVVQNPALSGRLRDYTAVMDVPNPKSSTGYTKVYILAVSHVSKCSVTDTVNLIEQVRPDVVMIEICKDRLGLLATPFPAGERVWHTPSVRVSGIPDLPGFPKAEDLLSLLTCKPGRPISTVDIEEDTRRLQATGLFRTVQPSALPGTNQDAPLFVLRPDPEAGNKGAVRLDTVPPFNAIEFRCDPRTLPPITSLSLRVESTAQDAGAELPAPRAREIEARVKLEAESEDVNTLQLLMEARARILAAADAPVPLCVHFENVHKGVVEAVLRLVPQDGFVTGLEASASGGTGFGIEPFKALRQNDGLKVGLTSMLPAEALESLAGQLNGEDRIVDVDLPDGVRVGEFELAGQTALPHEVLRSRDRTVWRRWGWHELATAADEDPESQPLKDLLANSMSDLYGKLQRRAGMTAGVDGGDVWRVRFTPTVFWPASLRP